MEPRQLKEGERWGGVRRKSKISGPRKVKERWGGSEREFQNPERGGDNVIEFRIQRPDSTADCGGAMGIGAVERSWNWRSIERLRVVRVEEVALEGSGLETQVRLLKLRFK